MSKEEESIWGKDGGRRKDKRKIWKKEIEIIGEKREQMGR